MSYAMERQQANKPSMSDKDPAKGQSNQYTDTFNKGLIQEEVKLNEDFSYTSDNHEHYLAEADDSNGFIQTKDEKGNITNKRSRDMSEEGSKLEFLNASKATEQGISLDKTYQKHNKLSESPKIGDLVTESQEGRSISGAVGLTSPLVAHYPLPGLFIDDKPCVDDVAQMNIGDCYFLAAVIQILNSKPDVFKNIIKLSGNTVTTTFYKTDDNEHWDKETIDIPFGIVQGKTKGYKPQAMGSLYRMDEKVDRSFYSGEIEKYSNSEAGYIKITRRDYHKAALWVNLLEQAFSKFAQTYGQYGDLKAPNSKSHKTYSDRFATISSGTLSNALNIFFGDKAKSDPVARYVGDIDLTKHQSEVLKLMVEKKQNAGDNTKAQVFLAASYHGKKDSHISTEHAYSIMDVDFVGKEDYKDVDPNDSASLEKFIKGLDLQKSTVVLRNPQIALENIKAATKHEGISVVDLKSFFVGVDQMSAARVEI